MTSNHSQLPREDAIGAEETTEETVVLRLRPATARRRRARCSNVRRRGAEERERQEAKEAEESVKKKNCSPSPPIYRLGREGVGSNVCPVAADCACIGPP